MTQVKMTISQNVLKVYDEMKAHKFGNWTSWNLS